MIQVDMSGANMMVSAAGGRRPRVGFITLTTSPNPISTAKKLETESEVAYTLEDT